MNIFNSLGSNYDLKFIFQALFSKANKNNKKEFTKYLSEKFDGEVILTYKGRQAIEIALKILDLPKDSFVAINGFTCYAVYKAVADAGLKIEYIDIEKGDLNFSPQQLKEAISKNPKIKVVIIQNTLGYPAKIKEISKICKENNLILIEDLAHSTGGQYGDFAALSFSQDKLIDAVSGGALIVKNQKYFIKLGAFKSINEANPIKDKLYPLFTYLIRITYPFVLGKIIHKILKSLNLLSQPMDYKNAAPVWSCGIIKDQFQNLESSLNHRKKIANVYARNLNKNILNPNLIINIEESANLRFPIFTDNRANLIKFLKSKEIFVSDIWYDAPIAPKKYMTQTNYNHNCPNSEEISEKILNLPTHKNVTEKEAEAIAGYINQWLNQ